MIKHLQEGIASLSRRVARLAEAEGEWKTIRGRRVFIGKGESLEEALKRSLARDTAKAEGGKAEEVLIKEAKAAAKGVKLPGGDAAKWSDRGYEWRKRGGYIDSIEKNLTASLKATGWKMGDRNFPGNPDGSYMGNDVVYRKEGWSVSISKMFGPDKHSNSFSIKLRRDSQKPD